MRNVFDQYSQPENRLTHALLASLNADPRLLRGFIRWAGAGRPSGRLRILEQSLPEQPTGVRDRTESETSGLPDGWMFDSHGWALLIESKVAATPSDDQITRHLRTARRRGFSDPQLLWLTVVPVNRALARGVTNRTWADLYEWLIRKNPRSKWARMAAEYFEVAEVQADMKEQLHEGTLTRFAGVPFDDDNPYSYSQAKRLLGLMRNDLRQKRVLEKELGMNRSCGGRGAITGRATSLVWDFISTIASAGDKVFTQNVHLTLGISDQNVSAYVTVPNGIRSRLRPALLGDTEEYFSAVIGEAAQRLDKVMKRYPGARPEVVVVQRRYASQSSIPRIDAVLKFDPRTAFATKPRRGEPSVLVQPQWLSAAYQALKHRRANLQLQIGAVFPYDACRVTRIPDIVQAVTETWVACKPVVQVLRDASRSKPQIARSRKKTTA